MSGRLTLAPAETAREPHEHAAFTLDSGRKLRFRDPRRFGALLALPTASLGRDRHFARLGV
jgi:formamidopyrimidine-DNA glycosylase